MGDLTCKISSVRTLRCVPKISSLARKQRWSQLAANTTIYFNEEIFNLPRSVFSVRFPRLKEYFCPARLVVIIILIPRSLRSCVLFAAVSSAGAWPGACRGRASPRWWIRESSFDPQSCAQVSPAHAYGLPASPCACTGALFGVFGDLRVLLVQRLMRNESGENKAGNKCPREERCRRQRRSRAAECEGGR